MTISAQDFLNATDLSISEEVTLEEFDPADLQDFTGLAEGNISFTESEALDGLLQSSKASDKTDNPSTPSYQPLNEAGVLTSGEAINKSAIGSVTNNSIGIQEDAQTSLENTAKFIPSDLNFNPTEETLKKMREAQDVLANGVKSIANGAELANSGIKFAGGNLQFAGNSIQLGSDGMVHMTSPIINTVADVENKQATTIQETTNQKTTVAKSTFTQIEELESTVSGNKMTTVTNSDISVSNYKSTTALEKHSTNSQTIENTAGDLIKNRSLNGITTEADGVVSTTSPSISLIAAEGAKSQLGQKDVIGSGATGLTQNQDGSFDVTASSPTGETVKFSGLNSGGDVEKWKSVGGLQGQDADNVKPVKKKTGGGNLSILADGSGGTVSIINKNTVLSSTAHFNASVGGNLSQVAQGNVTQSGRFVNAEADAGLTLNGSGYIRQQSGRTGTFISNGFTFAGFRFPNLSKFIDKAKNIPLEIREIPALSALPLAISVSDLADCLPKKYTDPDQPEDEVQENDVPDEIAAPTAADARQRNKAAAISVGKDVGAVGEGGLLDQVQGTGSTKIDGNTILSKDSSPTDQTVLPRNKITSAVAVFKGGSDIYPPESDEAFDLYRRQGALIIDPDADEEVGGPELVITLIDSISALSITNVSIKLNQKPDFAKALSEDINAVKNYLYSQFEIPDGLLTSSKLLTPEQTKFIENALAIPEQKEILDKLIEAVRIRSAVGGFLSFLSEAYEKVSDSVSIASDLIEDNSERNVFQVLEGASDIAATLTNDEVFSDLTNIINSSESLSNIYGQVNSIVKDGNSTVSNIIDNISFKDIENVIAGGLNTIGVENLQTASSIAKILRDVKNSEDYKQNGLNTEVSERIIIDIVNETGLNTQQAIDIYNQSQTVIAQVLAGDVESIVEGSELQNVLGFFIGSSNAALLSDLKNVYTQGARVLDQGRQLFNTGQGLFQNGVDFYNTIQSIPALVGMMNSYEIPLLNQVKIVLQCLELVEQVKRIIENVREAGKSFGDFTDSIEGTFQAFEDLLGLDPNSNQPVSSLEAASEGFAKGEVAPIPPTNKKSARDNFSSPELESPLTDGVSKKRLKDINTINNSVQNTTNTNTNQTESTFINGQQVTAENCSSIIFSYSADTHDSNDPSDWSETVSTEEAIGIIETLPRLTQMYNSIKEAPAEIAINGNQTIFGDLTPQQLDTIQTSTVNTPTDSCYLAPQLNLLESTVQVLQIKDNVMLYKMSYPQSLKFNNKNIFPTNNTIVQIYVEEFYNNKTREEMQVYRTEEFFSPRVYSFKTTVFDRDKNLGIAYLMNSQTRIHLKSASSTPYNYSITDIGKKLDPIIIDAYIVA